MATPDLSHTLYKRYNRIMRRALAGVLLVAGVLVYLQVQQALQSEKERLVQTMREHALALDSLLRNTSGAVRMLQHVAQQPMPDTPVPADALLRQLRQEGSLDTPPAPWGPGDIGNLTGPGTGGAGLAEPELERELRMALALNPSFAAIRRVNPSAAWVYYVSARRFINMYPWVASSEFTYGPALLEKDFFLQALPAANPAREPFWTDAYLDEAGQGLMVTAAAPVYDSGGFRGTVALDLTLGELNRTVRGTQARFGTTFVVNQAGQLLAHPELVQPDARTVLGLRDALPGRLASLGTGDLAAAEGQLVLHGGHYVESILLKNAPFRVILVVPQSELVLAALRTGLVSVVLLVCGLALMLVVATRVTSREFIQPAQKLVNYIEEESHGPAVAMPQVPAGWRPWFETIRRVFNAHLQLVSIQQELDVARRMQQSIVPNRFPSRPDLQIFARMIPAREVGGDFYDFFWLDEARLGLVIADVSGKGVPASLFMAVSRTLLRATAPTAEGPGRCLELTNDLLSQDNDATMFVTLFYGILDTRTGTMVYANAGHNPPYLLAPGGGATLLPRTGGMALGVMDGMPYAEGSVTLAPGETLLLYTDGVTEAFNPAGEEYTEARLLDCLAGPPPADAVALINGLVDSVNGFAAGAPQADDITCLAIRFNAPSTLAGGIAA